MRDKPIADGWAGLPDNEHCEKISTCTRSPSFGYSWSGWAPWAIFCTRFRQVTALRLAHPGWAIDWVVEPRWQALLTAEDSLGRVVSQPLVDRVHFAPTKEWRRAPLSENTLREIKLLRRTLQEGDYDAVLDLQGAIRSAVVGRMAKCRRLIGEAELRGAAASRRAGSIASAWRPTEST